MRNSEQEERATMTRHVRALQFRYGEFFPDMVGEELLRDSCGAIENWLHSGDVGPFTPLLARVAAHKTAKGSYTGGDAAAALYAAAGDMRCLVEHGTVSIKAGPSADDYPGLMRSDPIGDAFARRAERNEGRSEGLTEPEMQETPPSASPGV